MPWRGWEAEIGDGREEVELVRKSECSERPQVCVNGLKASADRRAEGLMSS